MNSTSYGEFSRALHEKFSNQRVPIDATLELTRRCPLECQHCYNNLPMGDLPARNRELTKEEYFKLLADLAEMNVIWLLFTGGEIFARKDFLEIYTCAKQKGFLITLFTNGILINEQIADYLRDFPPFSIEITLYGRTKETYEALTQREGSYDRCIRGIQLLMDRGLPLKLKTVGTKINRHEIASMKQFAEQELGVEFKFDSLMSPRIDCSQSPLNVRLSPEDVVALDMYWPTVADGHRKVLQGEISTPAVPMNTVYSCGGGLKTFAIDPYGHMSICVISHQETYDIRQGGVCAGWEHFLLNIRQRKATRVTKCARCRLHSVCSMCPANGELENGDPESPVEFLCEVAHLRALALGFEVPEHGDCDFCNDPERRESLERSVLRIASQEITPAAWTGPQSILPILNSSQAAAGCGGCGALH
jgi:radical SAM protein with 4Fe4S-binding SPASM domain